MKEEKSFLKRNGRGNRMQLLVRAVWKIIHAMAQKLININKKKKNKYKRLER